MTFGRPSMIPESYLKLELPYTSMQVMGQTPQPAPTPQMDGMFYTATMWVDVLLIVSLLSTHANLVLAESCTM